VIRLFDFERGWPITIAQMHGIRLAGGKTDNPHRLNQAHRFVEMINSVAEPGDRIVACGDFNVLPESQTFAVLARIGLRDLVTGSGFTDTRSPHYHKSTRYADYMLINDLLVPHSFDVIQNPVVSDHLPLLLEI
jgi:endonuclease/exonuclease/phosphatase family metal-dependent hydrolase